MKVTVDMSREDLTNMIDARVAFGIRDFDERVIMPRHKENSKKLDENCAKTEQVLSAVDQAKGSIKILVIFTPIIAALLVAVINHFWK